MSEGERHRPPEDEQDLKKDDHRLGVDGQPHEVGQIDEVRFDMEKISQRKRAEPPRRPPYRGKK